jgi:beta-lactamase class A
MLKQVLIFLIGGILLTIPSKAQQQTFRRELEGIINGKNARVGLAMQVMETGDTISINGNSHFPMQSVYKFHLALAVLDLLDKGKLKLDQLILLKKQDLLPETHSPLREKYPDANVQVSIDELLRYTVGQSDNNGCDILFRLVGGTKYVDRYIARLGITDIAIVATEQEMHTDYKIQFKNYCSPKSATALLVKFMEGKLLSKSSTKYLMDVMQQSISGPDKLKGLLPPGTLVAHKTGYSGTDGHGLTYATNDIGIVTLPNGNHLIVSVFVTMSKEQEAVNDRIIAAIAKAMFDKYGAN